MKPTISHSMKPFLVLKCEMLTVLRMRQHEKTARLTLKPHKKRRIMFKLRKKITSKLKLIILKQSSKPPKKMKPRMRLKPHKRIRIMVKSMIS